MRFNILGDFTTESGLGNILNTLSKRGYRNFFESKNYGGDLLGITVVLICQDPSLHLKQRIRFSKKEQKIYLDIMLDLDQIITTGSRSLEEMVLKSIVDETLRVLKKYSPKDVDISRFELDLRTLFSNQTPATIQNS